MLLFITVRKSEEYLHFGYRNCGCRAHAEATLTKYALTCLVGIRLGVNHSKNTLRAYIHALFAAFAFLRIDRNHIHCSHTSRFFLLF